MQPQPQPLPSTLHLLRSESLALESRLLSDLSLHETHILSKFRAISEKLVQTAHIHRSHRQNLHFQKNLLKKLCFEALDTFHLKVKHLESDLNLYMEGLRKEVSSKVNKCLLSILGSFKEKMASGIENLDFKAVRIGCKDVLEGLEVKMAKGVEEEAKRLEEELALMVKNANNPNISFNSQQIKELMEARNDISVSSIRKREEPGDDSSSDEIDRKLRNLDEKMKWKDGARPSSLPPTSSSLPPAAMSAGVIKNAAESGTLMNRGAGETSSSFFGKLKSLFKKKGEVDDGNYTEMKLGGESKFKYDPVKKRYVFEEEEEKEEAPLPPPPIKGADKPKEADVGKKDEGGVQDLLKPNARMPFRKKKKEEGGVREEGKRKEDDIGGVKVMFIGKGGEEEGNEEEGGRREEEGRRREEEGGRRVEEGEIREDEGRMVRTVTIGKHFSDLVERIKENLQKLADEKFTEPELPLENDLNYLEILEIIQAKLNECMIDKGKKEGDNERREDEQEDGILKGRREDGKRWEEGRRREEEEGERWEGWRNEEGEKRKEEEGKGDELDLIKGMMEKQLENYELQNKVNGLMGERFELMRKLMLLERREREEERGRREGGGRRREEEGEMREEKESLRAEHVVALYINEFHNFSNKKDEGEMFDCLIENITKLKTEKSELMKVIQNLLKIQETLKGELQKSFLEEQHLQNLLISEEEGRRRTEEEGRRMFDEERRRREEEGRRRKEDENKRREEEGRKREEEDMRRREEERKRREEEVKRREEEEERRMEEEGRRREEEGRRREEEGRRREEETRRRIDDRKREEEGKKIVEEALRGCDVLKEKVRRQREEIEEEGRRRTEEEEEVKKVIEGMGGRAVGRMKEMIQSIPIAFDEAMSRAESHFKLELQKLKKEYNVEVRNSDQFRNQLKANNNLIEIKQNQIQLIQNQLKTLLNQNELLVNTNNVLITENNNIKTEISSLREEIQVYLKENLELTKEISACKSEKTDLETQLASSSSSISFFLSSLSSNLSLLLSSISQSDEENIYFRSLLDSLLILPQPSSQFPIVSPPPSSSFPVLIRTWQSNRLVFEAGREELSALREEVRSLREQNRGYEDEIVVARKEGGRRREEEERRRREAEEKRRREEEDIRRKEEEFQTRREQEERRREEEEKRRIEEEGRKREEEEKRRREKEERRREKEERRREEEEKRRKEEEERRREEEEKRREEERKKKEEEGWRREEAEERSKQEENERRREEEEGRRREEDERRREEDGRKREEEEAMKKKLEDEISSLKCEIEQYEKKVSAKTKEFELEKLEKEKKESEIAQLTQKIEEMSNNIDESTNVTLKELQQLKITFNQMEQEKNDLTLQHKSQLERFHAVESDLLKSQTKINSQSDKLKLGFEKYNELLLERDKLEAENLELNQKLSQAIEADQLHSALISELQAKIRLLESEMELSQSNAKTREEFELLEEVLKSFQMKASIGEETGRELERERRERKEVEEINESLMKEKKKLLDQNDKFLSQLNAQENYLELQSVKQKLSNTEEEAKIMKANYIEIVQSLTKELNEYKQREEEKKLGGKEEGGRREGGGKDDQKEQGGKKAEEVVRKEGGGGKEEESIKKKEEGGGKRTGLFGGLASLFLTEKDMK